MIRAHKEAVLTRLRGDPFLTSTVYEGVVEDRPNRYAALFFDSGHRTTDRLTGPSTTGTFSIIVHSVGTTPDQAQTVAEHVLAQLIDWTPDVPGHSCRRLRHTVTVPVQRDPDGIFPVHFCVDEFALVTQAI
jgi:hypothetical protein